jgi:hypothetical protein
MDAAAVDALKSKIAEAASDTFSVDPSMVLVYINDVSETELFSSRRRLQAQTTAVRAELSVPLQHASAVAQQLEASLSSTAQAEAALGIGIVGVPSVELEAKPSAPPSPPIAPLGDGRANYGDSAITIADLYYWISEAYGSNYDGFKLTGVTPRQHIDQIAEQCDGLPQSSFHIIEQPEYFTCAPCSDAPPPPPAGRRLQSLLFSEAPRGALSAAPARVPAQRRRMDSQVEAITDPAPAVLAFAVHAALPKGTWFYAALGKGRDLVYASIEIAGLKTDTISSLGSAPIIERLQPPCKEPSGSCVPGTGARPHLAYVKGHLSDGTSCYTGIGTRQSNEHFLTTTLNVYQKCHKIDGIPCCNDVDMYLWIPKSMLAEDGAIALRKGSYFSMPDVTYYLDEDVPAAPQSHDPNEPEHESPPPPPPPPPPAEDPCIEPQNAFETLASMLESEAVQALGENSTVVMPHILLKLYTPGRRLQVEECSPPPPPQPATPPTPPPPPASPAEEDDGLPEFVMPLGIAAGAVLLLVALCCAFAAWKKEWPMRRNSGSKKGERATPSETASLVRAATVPISGRAAHIRTRNAKAAKGVRSPALIMQVG